MANLAAYQSFPDSLVAIVPRRCPKQKGMNAYDAMAQNALRERGSGIPQLKLSKPLTLHTGETVASADLDSSVIFYSKTDLDCLSHAELNTDGDYLLFPKHPCQ